MNFQNIISSLQHLPIASEYETDINLTKGNEISDNDQLSIRWKENGLNKLIQLFPEIRNMQIRKWKIWLCASLDKEDGRYWWNETIYENRSKMRLLSVAREKILEGINKLNEISESDLIKVSV